MQSKHISDFFRHFFSVPLLPALAVICSVSAIIVTSDATGKMHTATSDNTRLSSESTEPETTEAATVPMEPETEPVPEPLDYRQFIGLVPENSGFYQDRLAIIGDSIAYGFCAYGYIPYEHNIAKGSLAMRNYTDAGWFNEFDVNGRTVKCMDAVIAKQPRLLYVSMGMNDVNLTSAQTYANNYVGFLKKVRANVPNCIIVAANITPIASFSSFTGINNIKNANAAMNAAVKAMNDPNIILFDAYSVVSGGGTYMASGYSAGDGIHLAGHVYKKILNRLAIVLDQYSVKERLSA